MLAVIVSLGLQILPICKVASTAVLNPVTSGIIFRLAMISAALLGGVDAVSGASTVISSPLEVKGTNGVPMLYRILTTPYAADFFNATNLPPGLSVSSTTGRITGTPTNTGVWNVFIFVSEAGAADRTTTTNVVFTIVSFSPLISSQSSDIITNLNSSVTISVNAEGGTPLYYQWKFNNNDILNATNSDYTFAAAPATAGNYTCLITNKFGNITSSPIKVGLSSKPVVTKQPANITAVSGSTVTFSISYTGTPKPVFQWCKDNVPINNETNSSLTLINISVSDVGKYSVLLKNMAGVTASADGTLTVLVPPTITIQPISQAINAGESVTFICEASGYPALNFQWRKDGVDLNGQTSNTLTINNATLNDVGDYELAIDNLVGSIVSDSVHLTVNQSNINVVLSNITLNNDILSFDISGQPNVNASIFNSIDLQNWNLISSIQLSPDGKYTYTETIVLPNQVFKVIIP